MKRGYLSQYFDGVAAKRLSAVEADVLRSNQHEFNGVEGLRKLLGEPDGKVRYPTRFVYLTDSDDDPIVEDGSLTWYDARQRARAERDVMRWEYRLYFPTNRVSQLAGEGDALVIARRPDKTLLAIVAEKDTTVAQQILWLFGLSDLGHPGFSIREELESEQDRLEFASRLILDSIGVLVEDTEETYLDAMLRAFDGTFPSTRDFSAWARSTLQDIRPLEDPDDSLMAWMEREEILFRTLERHLIGERLSKGFGGDVDSFVAFSLSVQNRRKSRVGHALENHMEVVLRECGVLFGRSVLTENRSRPDFVFPGGREYHDRSFDSRLLTMLGVKSTCKDRWRQVLAEADRIPFKHLLTLEVAISSSQTDEMRSRSVQLVLPKRLHHTYSGAQREWLMDVAGFIETVRERQQGSAPS